jgi:hypothetical protein
MTVSVSTLSGTIADLSIMVTKHDGTSVALSIKDLADMTATPKFESRDCPVLYPQYSFQTGVGYEPASMGSDPFQEVTYTLNYYYAHIEVGAGRWASEFNAQIADNCGVIAEAFAANCRSLGVYGSVEVSAISDPGVVPGPDDKQFYGATVALQVSDARNA